MGIFGTEDMGLEMRRSGADRMNAAWRKVLGYGSGEEFQEGVRELRAVIGERNRTWMEELLRLESVSERIDLCVEKAYESEDHTLFADYLLSFMEEKNEAKKNYYRGLVPGYSRVRMADLGDHTIRKDVWQKEEFHTAGTLTDLGAGITRLDKDVAVQLGLCFGMDRQSVNRWLFRAFSRTSLSVRWDCGVKAADEASFPFLTMWASSTAMSASVDSTGAAFSRPASTLPVTVTKRFVTPGR